METLPYRGYLIRTHPLTGVIWIEKDRQHIAYAATTADAKATIHMLTEDPRD